MKKIIVFSLIISLIFSFSACSGKKEENETVTSSVIEETSPVLLTETTWSDDVKAAVNDLVTDYGNTSDNYNENSYAVFDFDNTTAVFDVSEQFMAYQMDNMCVGFRPEEFREVYSTGLSDLDADLTSYGYGNGSYNNWLNDLENSYTYLWDNYGPFSPEGLSEEKAAEMRKDNMWLEFSVKFRALYSLITDVDTTIISYPWSIYWFYGFTEDELYDVSYRCHTYYKDRDSQAFTVTTSSEVESEVGVVTTEYTTGVSVTPNNIELWKVLDQNGIDVWVCSASYADVVCAAIDAFGLRDYVTGVIGMTSVIDENGRITNEYDFENGFARYPQEDGSWKNGTVPINAQTQEYGKVQAIDHVLVTEYGCGPIAGFGDSTGDFNFCTEYKDMKLSIMYNRANRKVTDGGGVLAEVAMYQKNTLKYDLASAVAAGDTLYLLQGRDENGTRAFLNTNKTLRLGETETRLFRNSDNEDELQYMIDNNMTTEEAINTFAMITTAEDENNNLGFDYGFLKEYNGYHSH